MLNGRVDHHGAAEGEEFTVAAVVRGLLRQIHQLGGRRRQHAAGGQRGLGVEGLALAALEQLVDGHPHVAGERRGRLVALHTTPRHVDLVAEQVGGLFDGALDIVGSVELGQIDVDGELGQRRGAGLVQHHFDLAQIGSFRLEFSAAPRRIPG